MDLGHLSVKHKEEPLRQILHPGGHKEVHSSLLQIPASLSTAPSCTRTRLPRPRISADMPRTGRGYAAESADMDPRIFNFSTADIPLPYHPHSTLRSVFTNPAEYLLSKD